jgi:SNF2 family DNA or RNA helicase
LRFLLADDPGAGKTIMTGLLIKELIARGDLQRCMVVCPGNLAEPWQDELNRRFHLPFDILTNDKLEAARTGNWFLAIVAFHDDTTHQVHYLRRPFQREPDFGVTSVNYDFAELLERAEKPK